MADPHRQIHIRVPARLHRALRLLAAAEDKSIQDLVVQILTKNVPPSLLGDDDTTVEKDFRDERNAIR